MAKDKITEYDATANNNTVCGDVNIAENSALPSDMNNFAREIMSHLKEGLGSGTPLYVDQTNNRVGINKTPTVALDVSGDADLSGTLDVTGTVTAGGLTIGSPVFPTGVLKAKQDADNTRARGILLEANADDSLLAIGYNNGKFHLSASYYTGGSFQPISVFTSNLERLTVDTNGDISFYEDTGTTPKLFWDASAERLGIGTASPTAPLTVNGINEGIRFTDNNQEVSNYYGHIWKDYNGQAPFVIESISNGGAGKIALNPDGGNVGIGDDDPDMTTVIAYSDAGTDFNANDFTGGLGIYNTDDTNNTSSAINFKGGSRHDVVRIGAVRTSNSASTSSNSADFVVSTRHLASSLGERFRITSNGSVGIGTSSPQEQIHSASSGSNALRVSGSANDNAKVEIGFDTSNGAYLKAGSSVVTKLQFYVDNISLAGEFRSNGDFYTNDGTVHSLSDSRVKKDIADLTDGLDIVKQLRPRTFKYNGKATTLDDNRTRYGFVADEVMAIASQYVSQETQTIDGVEVDDFKSISTTKMIPMLVKAIQELEARIVALETA